MKFLLLSHIFSELSEFIFEEFKTAIWVTSTGPVAGTNILVYMYQSLNMLSIDFEFFCCFEKLTKTEKIKNTDMRGYLF